MEHQIAAMFPLKVDFIFLSRNTILYLVLYSLLTVKALNLLNANDLKVFKDFLDNGYLRHGIIMHHGFLNLNKAHLNMFFVEHYMRFVRINHTQSVNDLNNVFDGKFSRAGILIPILEGTMNDENILKKASEKGIFNNSNAWFFMGNEKFSNVDTIRLTLVDLRIEANADITVAVKINDSTFLLYDVFKTCTNKNASLNIEYKGNWSSDIGFTLLPIFHEGFVRRRHNFCNSTVKAGTALLEKPLNFSSLEYLGNTKDYRHFDTMQRKTYNLMKMMEPLFNLSLEVVLADSWGSPLSNGTWTGVIGDILAHNAKFAICPIRSSTMRAKVLLFTPELHTEHIRFLLRHPRHTTIRNIFFQPLSPTVWWCILALLIYLSIQLGIHVRFEYRAQKLQLTYKAPTHIEPRWDFVVLQILEVIFMQGPSPDLYKFLSTRTLIIAACIFSIMLQQFYSAFIVGSLLATPSRTITTLEALYNSSLEIGMEEIPYNYEFFINTTNQLVRNMYTKRICKNSRKNILSLEQGVERIGHGGFAFHVSLNRAYRLLIAELSESAFCDLQEIAIYPPFQAGLAAPKDSIYREYLAKSTLLFRETGLLQYNEKQWATHSIDCSLVQGNEVEVDMEHFVPALALLAFAIGISFIALLIEFTWKWREKQRNLH